MQRAVLNAVCFVCLLSSSGCVIPYAFPKLDYTRALQLDAPPTEVHVFRVDKTQITTPYPVNIRERLSQISAGSNGKVAAQFKPSLRSGIYMFMVALNYDFGSGKYLALRAYRPGYELVEIESLEKVEQIHWTPAKDWAAQEQAVDSLLPDPHHESRGSCLQQEVGSSSAAHRQALLFGAAEYDRLAQIAETPDDQMRCQRKARNLRERASE
jgi:hypothetical protein